MAPFDVLSGRQFGRFRGKNRHRAGASKTTRMTQLRHRSLATHSVPEPILSPFRSKGLRQCDVSSRADGDNGQGIERGIVRAGDLISRQPARLALRLPQH